MLPNMIPNIILSSLPRISGFCSSSLQFCFSMLLIACTNSPTTSGLIRYSLTPQRMACCAYENSAYALKTIALLFIFFSLSYAIESILRPSIKGILTSVIIKSGFSCNIRARPSSPFSALPTTW